MIEKQPLPAYMRRYVWRVMVFMSSYVALLVGGKTYAKWSDPSQFERITLAVLTALPICGVFWAIFHLLNEVDDEYQRLLFAKQILLGTAWALVIVTLWEFLKVYDVVGIGPQWTGAIWFATFGLAGAYVRLRA